MTNGQPLPGIQGMMQIDEENPAPRIFNFQGMTAVYYREVVENLLKMMPGKFEAYEEAWRIRQFKK